MAIAGKGKRMIRFFTVIIMYLWVVQAAYTVERLPHEYFAKPADYHEVKISPDGKYFAIRFDQKGKRVLVMLKRDGMKMDAVIKPHLDGHIDDFRWVNNERLTYEVVHENGALDFPRGTGNMYAVNRNGARHEILFGIDAALNARSNTRLKQRKNTRSGYSFIDMLPDDEDNILIAEYPYAQRGTVWSVDTYAKPIISRLNIYTGITRKVDVLPVPFSRGLSDSDGNVRVAIGTDDNNQLSVQWKPTIESDWERFDLQNAGITSAVPTHFQDNIMYLTGQPGIGGARAMYRFDLSSGEYELLYQHDHVDISSMLNDFSTHNLVGFSVEPGKPSYEYLLDNDNRTVKLHKSLRKAFGDKNVIFTSSTRDGSEVVVFVYDSQDPGQYYLFNTQSNEAQHLITRRSWIDPALMQPKQPFRFEARDGVELSGYITLPADGDSAAPMIVLVHGGPYGVRDHWQFESDVQFLANRGYAILQVNFRGSGGYGPDFVDSGYGEWGGRMQDDVTDATHWAVKQGYANAERICIYGASYGGYAALMGVVKEPDLYQCAIGYVGVYDLATQFEKGDIPGQRNGLKYLEEALGKDPEKLAERSPAKNAGRIKAKVFLVHGGEDVRVPIKHAYLMRDALEAADNPPEWLVYGGEGHGFYDPEHRAELYRRMEAFLDEHIGETSKP